MSNKSAKDRNAERRRARQSAERLVSMHGWADGVVPTRGQGWPFKASTEAVDKHSFRVRVDVPGRPALVETVPYSRLYEVSTLAEQAVLAYTGLPVIADGGRIWYHELYKEGHRLHWLKPRIKLASGPVLTGVTKDGDAIAFTIFEDRQIDARWPYHVQWRLIDGPDLLNWSSLDYFDKSILA